MPKVGWGSNFGKEVVDAESGFNDYDGPTPPKGVYIGNLKTVRLKVNRNGDNMLAAVVEVDEPKGSPKAKYNGYGMWWQGNVTDEGAGFINKFIDAIGADRKAFWAGRVIHDTEGATKPSGDTPSCVLGTVTKIGTVTLKPSTKVKVLGRTDTYQGETSLKVGNFLQLTAADGQDSADADEEEIDEDIEEEDVDADGDPIEEEEEDEESEEDSDEEEEEEEESEEFDEEALRAELEDLNLTKLKAYARNAYKLKTIGMDQEDLIEAILEAAAEAFDGDEEEEEEPEPPKAAPKRAAAKRPAPAAAKAKPARAARKPVDEPPF